MKADVILDCYGLLCPLPIIKTSEKIKELKKGKVLEVISTDEGIKRDMASWCRVTGQELLKIEEEEGSNPKVYHVFIRKLT